MVPYRPYKLIRIFCNLTCFSLALPLSTVKDGYEKTTISCPEQHTKVPEGAAIGGSAGGVTGGVLGLLAGIGALAISGVGPFIAAGPIMAALSGAAVGAALGGIAGALDGLGMPEYEAKQYEAKVKDGNILISVHTDDSDEADRVEDIMEAADAEDVSTTSEAGVSDSKKYSGD